MRKVTAFSGITESVTLSEINEQKIGTTVFGRPPDYDSSIDGIVRPRASRLRQRLELYFNGEGADELVRITLPRGSYVPVFEPNPTYAPADETPSIPIVEPSLPSTALFVPSPPLEPARTPSILRNPRIPWILVIALLVALLVVGLRSAKRGYADIAIPSKPHPLWSLLLRPNQRTIVVPSDTGLVMWQRATGKIDLENYQGGELPGAEYRGHFYGKNKSR